MIPVTTASTITIEQFGTGASLPAVDLNAAVLERYFKRTLGNRQMILSDAPLPEASIYAFEALKPAWLVSTENVIQGSIGGDLALDDPSQEGRWLTQAVADAAISFFRTTADLLPGEPHIYSSRQGDLVAEFRVPGGELTSIISPEFVLLFSVINDAPSQNKLLPTDDIRAAVEDVINRLVAGTDGDVATKQ